MSSASGAPGSLGKNQRKILDYLKGRPEGVWSSTSEILAATGLSRSQFYQAARSLDAWEIIDVRRDPYRGSANIYMLRQRS